ncbi:hypothetical protein AE621_23060 [Acidovorax sp. SD340]|nr:hypothetical protein AE621_23060 [Acidovorax sp. SD340]
MDRAEVLMKFNGQSGAGMVPMFMGRAPHQWQHVLAFIDSLPKQDDAGATGKRSAGAPAAADVESSAINFGGCVASATAVPDGNHGDNFEEGRA